jgi:prolyl 4-hydroxylase
MSLLVHFSPDLRTWLSEALDRGRPASELVQTMTEGRMAPPIARGIVEAFLAARGKGEPIPVDALTLDEQALEYVQEGPIHKAVSGNRIQTFDRAVRVVARSERPVLALLRDVLAKEECEAIMELARPRLVPSTVVEPKTGRNVVVSHRSSLGMFFRLGENALVERLDRRISEVMNLPVENGEGFQVLHYAEGAETTPHVDFLRPSNPENAASIARSGQRVSTLIAYLNDVEDGGETVFPKAGWVVSPEPGTAVLFEYANRLGQVDDSSVHAGNRVTRGEKWVLTKWMRERRFVPKGAMPSDGMRAH